MGIGRDARMAALRLIQGFQFVVRSNTEAFGEEGSDEKVKYFAVDDERTPKPFGAIGGLRNRNGACFPEP